MNIITIGIILSFQIIYTQMIAQTMPTNEINCFDNFEYNDSGNNLVNTYLLAMLNYKMTPHNLLGLERGTAPEAVALSNNNSEFEIEFKNRLEKWFNPNKRNAFIKVSNPFNKIVTKKSKNRRIHRVSQKGKQTPIGSNEKEKLVIEFFYESNQRGLDPEAMLISTKDYLSLERN